MQALYKERRAGEHIDTLRVQLHTVPKVQIVLLCDISLKKKKESRRMLMTGLEICEFSFFSPISPLKREEKKLLIRPHKERRDEHQRSCRRNMQV